MGIIKSHQFRREGEKENFWLDRHEERHCAMGIGPSVLAVGLTNRGW